MSIKARYFILCPKSIPSIYGWFLIISLTSFIITVHYCYFHKAVGGEIGSKSHYTLINDGKNITITDVLTGGQGWSLQDRMELANPKDKRVLLMWDVKFSQENLRGCNDWNCEITTDRSRLNKADAIFIGSSAQGIQRQASQYFVHYSQESPVHSPNWKKVPPDYFNLSLSFRMDTHGASPYGYVVRLAPESQLDQTYLEQLSRFVRQKKTRAVAWFVSNCNAPSKRDDIARKLQKFISIDIYGGCGPFKCSKGQDCRKLLETYHFYLAAENSICRDYITEKLWNTGLGTLLVPIVLRRSIVEPYLPPGSFIAVDDYKTANEMGLHLQFLIDNPSEYLKYFEWRLKYATVVLDGNSDPSAERLFGFCQVCRLVQLQPRPTVIINNIDEWWRKSCEPYGALNDAFPSS